MIRYSYKQDERVPSFDDTHPLLVFDGVCVLCSGGAAKLMIWDKAQKFRFATAQSRLGHALLAHYDCDTVNFNTVLVVSNGYGFTKSDAYIETARSLGGWWKVFIMLKLIPRPLRDWLYDIKARNRYNWFGKTEYCKLLPEMDKRILDR